MPEENPVERRHRKQIARRKAKLLIKRASCFPGIRPHRSLSGVDQTVANILFQT
jgi:hypothetical protein